MSDRDAFTVGGCEMLQGVVRKGLELNGENRSEYEYEYEPGVEAG